MAKKRIVATGNWNSAPKQKAPAPPAPPAPQTAPDKPGILQKAKNMAASYISKGFSGKRAEPEVIEVRTMSCHGLDDIGLAPCEFRGNSETEGRYMCLECGCGDREATWLNKLSEDEYSKLEFPNVMCPLNMPGFTNHTLTKDETPERTSHYSGFARKKKLEEYCQTMGVSLVELSVPISPDADENAESQ